MYLNILQNSHHCSDIGPDQGARLCKCVLRTWKKRWFILRSGRMSGDPDVLEYYKNDHSKKPIRVIDLHFCEQVDAGLTFKKKEFQDSFVFDIKTIERTFYLVAETEEEMNKWVRSICQICGFNQSDENADVAKNAAIGSQTPRSSIVDFGGSVQALVGDHSTHSSSHASQPSVFTFENPIQAQPILSSSAPQDYLFLHQCMSKKTENSRSASFSQHGSTKRDGDTTSEKLSEANSHCVNGISGQIHGFHVLPKPEKQHIEQRVTTAYDLPRSLGYDGAAKYGSPGLDNDDEEVYTFNTPNSTLCRRLSEISTDSYDIPSTPMSCHNIPRTFTFDRNHNPLSTSSGDSAAAPPPRPPKPVPIDRKPEWGSPKQCTRNSKGKQASSAATIPRRNTLPAVDNNRLHRASSCETYDYPRHATNNEGLSVESVNDGFSSYLRSKCTSSRSESLESEDNYVPMNPGSLSSFVTTTAESCQDVYIPMSPGPHHFDFPGFSSATFPTRKGSTASLCHKPNFPGDLLPPPVNRNLKPDRKSKQGPMESRNNTFIDELPFKSPVTRSWSRPVAAVNPISSQNCRPLSTQSVTSTDSGDSEENYVPMNPISTSPMNAVTGSPGARKPGSVDYLSLDFQPSSPGPHRKPSTSSVTSDEKVDYVQVDKERTQALQNTMQEWTDVRQSSEPLKSLK
ncbi:GRB2-associated-binding protein 2 isoform X2 [Chiloscyllium plagiosum]|uniref:GRB2-associated-binding protein 2 isoform X2 n=1 Tax=Chiloscyllium plagiosum TaxID=36176 RepID=UPI001CB82FFD|nr:GRB2-associated-binding protein 2 isoform X2 [Chiloscyllium plagiosum]